MNITKNSTETITWDIDQCDAEAQVECSKGLIKITSVEINVKNNKSFNSFAATDEQFIRDTYKALGQLIAHVDKERNVGSVSETDKIPWPGRLKMPEYLDQFIHERNENEEHY